MNLETFNTQSNLFGIEINVKMSYELKCDGNKVCGNIGKKSVNQENLSSTMRALSFEHYYE